MNRISSVSAGLAALLTFGAFGHAVAQNDIFEVDNATTVIEDIDREPQRCINTVAIKETHVVDDETILFYMRNGDVYQNVLRRECRGLEREQRFSYEILGRNLCSTDWVTVIRSFGGSFEPGWSCGLGQFVGISEEQAYFLRHAEIPQMEDEAVELPEEDEEDDAGRADAAVESD